MRFYLKYFILFIIYMNNKANDEDLEYGKQHEILIKEMLEDMYAGTEYIVEFHSWKFSSFDFKILDKNNKIVHEYELKSRRIKSNTYPTLMFGETKLNYAKSQYKKRGGRFTFLWWCEIDETLLSWEWTPKSLDYILALGQNKIRHEKKKKCVYVPVSSMTEIVYE